MFVPSRLPSPSSRSLPLTALPSVLLQAPDVKLLNSKLVPPNWEAPKPKPVTLEQPEQRACQTGDCTIM
jgi:hypothetical protein